MSSGQSLRAIPEQKLFPALEFLSIAFYFSQTAQSWVLKRTWMPAGSSVRLSMEKCRLKIDLDISKT